MADCICKMFDAETVIVDPVCTATAHGSRKWSQADFDPAAVAGKRLYRLPARTLTQAAIEYEFSIMGRSPERENFGFPQTVHAMRPTFLAGAAAMAELFVQGQGPMLQLLRELAIAMTREAQALHDLINRKLPEPEDSDG